MLNPNFSWTLRWQFAMLKANVAQLKWTILCLFTAAFRTSNCLSQQDEVNARCCYLLLQLIIKLLNENNNIALGKIHRRGKKPDSQMLGTSKSQFASAETLVPYLYFREPNWKTKLETDNLERNANQMRNINQRLINFARGYSCIKEALKTFKHIWKKKVFEVSVDDFQLL